MLATVLVWHSLTVPYKGSVKVALLHAIDGALATLPIQVLFLPYTTADWVDTLQVPFSSAHLTNEAATGIGAGTGTGAAAPGRATTRHSLTVPYKGSPKVALLQAIDAPVDTFAAHVAFLP